MDLLQNKWELRRIAHLSYAVIVADITTRNLKREDILTTWTTRKKNCCVFGLFLIQFFFNKIFFQCFSGSVDYTAIYYKTLDQLLP